MIPPWRIPQYAKQPGLTLPPRCVLSCGARSNRQCLCEYWAVWLINCWVSCVHSWRRETDSPICREATHSAERKCHQQISPAAAEPWHPSLRSPRFLFVFSRFVSSPFSSCSSSSFLSSRVWSSLSLSLSHDVLYPLSLSLSPSLCCLISSSRVPGHGQGTNGTHARVKRASGGRGWRLGRVSALLLVLPLNDVSPSLLFCRSLSLRGFSRSRRSEPKGQRGQSPPSSLSLRPSLFTAFTVVTDETPMGVTARHTNNLYTQTHTHTRIHSNSQLPEL